VRRRLQEQWARHTNHMDSIGLNVGNEDGLTGSDRRWILVP
jgi:hypothetical protein